MMCLSSKDKDVYLIEAVQTIKTAPVAYAL